MPEPDAADFTWDSPGPADEIDGAWIFDKNGNRIATFDPFTKRQGDEVTMSFNKDGTVKITKTERPDEPT